MHQPMSGAQGQASDIEIHAREAIRLQDKMRQVISHHTGQPYEKVARDTDRDYFLTAEEAKEYGLVDEILESRDLGKEESALMLISTLGEFDPPAADGMLSFSRFTWSRDRLRNLDLRPHLRRDTVVLIGFADSPGPARLFYRTGQERFTMVDPESWP